MKNVLKKLIRIPKREETNLEAVELWSVRWRRTTEYSSSYSWYNRETTEFFTSKSDAERFRDELSAALCTLKDYDREIIISKE